MEWYPDSWHHFIVPSLIGDLSFRDNIQPSQVTPAVRNVLVRNELKEMVTWLVFVVGMSLMVAFAEWFGHGLSGSTGSLRQLYLLESAAVGLLLTGIIATTVHRNNFIRNAYVTNGVVLDVVTRSLYGEGGGSHSAKVYFRFLPAEMHDAPDSHLVGSGGACFEGLDKLSGDLGSFGADLTQGILVSVLYAPGKPKRHMIVPLKKGEVPAS